MDFVKKALNKGEGQQAAQGTQGTQGTAAAAPQASAGQAGQEDYVDKAFGMGSKKAGYNLDRNTQEKITDAGRDMYEKTTGSKVNPKFSN